MLSRKQRIFLYIVVGLSYVEWASLLSLLPPFYPSEAENKGCTPSQVQYTILYLNNQGYKLIYFSKPLNRFDVKLYLNCYPPSSTVLCLVLPIWQDFYLPRYVDNSEQGQALNFYTTLEHFCKPLVELHLGFQCMRPTQLSF